MNALAVDPVQPEVLYVATSFLFGSTQLHNTAVGVFLSRDGAQSWSMLAENHETAVVGLLPVSGRAGAVFALTERSRTPWALGGAPTVTAAAATVGETAIQETSDGGLRGRWVWLLVSLAALALIFAISFDLHQRPRGGGGDILTRSPVRNR